MKAGDTADMFHPGTKNWYRVEVKEGPLTYEQVMGPDELYAPEEETQGEMLKRRLREVMEDQNRNMLERMDLDAK